MEVGEAVDPLKLKGKEALDEMAEDDPDLEEDEYLQQYRDARLQEMKKKHEASKFGSVKEFDKTQWEIEVTRAPENVFVLIHLHQDQ